MLKTCGWSPSNHPTRGLPPTDLHRIGCLTSGVRAVTPRFGCPPMASGASVAGSRLLVLAGGSAGVWPTPSVVPFALSRVAAACRLPDERWSAGRRLASSAAERRGSRVTDGSRSASPTLPAVPGIARRTWFSMRLRYRSSSLLCEPRAPSLRPEQVRHLVWHSSGSNGSSHSSTPRM